jgi:uncharacterized membrane protein
MDSRQKGFFWVAALLLVAAVVHGASVYALPRLVMMRALSLMGTPNTMHFGKRPDATARMIVRPSPDLLYAACPYDLARGPLVVTAPVPHDTYWSVSAFDADTDNFYVRNDRDIAGDSFALVLVRHGQTLPDTGAVEHAIAFSPSETGVVLIRLLISDELRRAARCSAVAVGRPKR